MVNLETVEFIIDWFKTLVGPTNWCLCPYSDMPFVERKCNHMFLLGNESLFMAGKCLNLIGS
jgi:hypothetical protein